ncbi:unnamed protein product [Candidula unifasciata]|uniref:Uncharacterized protein n=1 Tax=Candidula unifasciata TaxID=100452 RepID=A0A8S3ZNC6_9EUPU|nr:unnamed protein product [Candidula unifasciata]
MLSDMLTYLTVLFIVATKYTLHMEQPRPLSLSSPLFLQIDMKVRQISQRLQLHTALMRDEWRWSVDPRTVLVLFFPWLGAQEKHSAKYRELYINLGLDVLTVKSLPTDFLWPPNSVKVAKHILKVLDEELKDYDHLIFHTMSIGSYNLTVLNMTAKEMNTRQEFLEKCRGIIFDSIVIGSNTIGIMKTTDTSGNKGDNTGAQSDQAIDRIIKGMASVVSNNSFFQVVITLMAKIYFTITKKWTLDFYTNALDKARDDPLKVPTLVLASKDDPMSDAVILEKLVELWQSEHNLPVTLCLWDSSKHAQHLVYHREDYDAAQSKFFSQVFRNIPESSSAIKKSKL